ncbi:SPOR domain-containing protein [Aliiglaciecola sp. LCG003]|uniref:SPOR domain-containing protein n=1 Tax=Aliiglaciecola sp. LCG003 TaxID=3053655 RepID=UPI002572FC20|nr:SPOR domain-containing protein [Aliiglaciecola sp. LCG003]WJG08286.1 SPOR domain-containing protein [Aliiglaciecola sp. LCG003]
MSSALQNRLVGTIIIVALAVIFLPDILDGKKQTSEDVFVSLPERPQMAAVQSAESFPAEQVKQQTIRKAEIIPDVATDDFDIANNEAATIESADASPSSSASNQPSGVDVDRAIVDPAEQNTATQPATQNDNLLADAGWVVQLGVFRHQKNVRELLSTLRNAGYRAFSRPVKTSTGELTKVFVGPELDKEKLAKALPHLRELTNLQGRISPFTVK